MKCSNCSSDNSVDAAVCVFCSYDFEKGEMKESSTACNVSKRSAPKEEKFTKSTKEPIKTRKGRDKGIIILAVFQFMIAFVIAVPLAKSEIEYGGILAVVSFGGMCSVGYGLLKRRNWGRILCIVEASVLLLAGLSAQIIPTVVISGFIIYYLAKKDTRLLFTSSNEKPKTSVKQKLSSTEIEKLLGRAYLGMGKVFEARKDSGAAFENYKKAKRVGAILHKEAIILMGDCYAQNNAKVQDAVDVYLEYVKLVPLQPLSQRVYTLLEDLCRIEEVRDNPCRKSEMDLNQKVIDGNPNVEWAYYYLGLGYLLLGDVRKAVVGFKKSRDLNPQRILTYYWLVKGLLQLRIEDGSAVETREILENAGKFLEKASKEEKDVRRQEVFFESGKLIIEELGGFDSRIDLSIKENADNLKQAVAYLEKAVAEDNNNGEYLFYLGRAYSLNEATSAAIKALLKAVEFSSSRKEYFYHLAKEYRVINSINGAKENLKKALSLDDKYAEAHSLLAEVCLLNKEYEEAENHCSQWGILKGYDLQNTLKLIQALYHQDKFGKVIEEVEKLPAFAIKSGEVPEVSFWIARSYSQIGSFDKAINWYKGLTAEPRNLYYLACALANKDNYKEAELCFDKVISQENDYRGIAFLQRGHLFLKMEKTQEAEEDYLKAYEIDSKNPNILSALGVIYYNTGNVEKALSFFSKTLEMDPNHYIAHSGMGLIREKDGEISEATKEYEIVIKHRGVPLSVYKRLGILYCKQGNYQKAFECLLQASTTGDECDSLLFYLGLAGQFCGEYEQALEIWNKLYHRHPDDTRLKLNILGVHYLLGCKYIKKEQYEEAIQEWKEYLNKYDTDEKSKKDLAEVFFRAGVIELINGKSGDINEAKNLFNKALELDRDNKNYLYYLGLCSLGMGSYNSCIAQLDRLLDLNPDNPRIKYHIGLSLFKNGHKEDAMKVFNEISNGKEKDTYAHHAVWIIANEHIKKGRYDEAITNLGML